MIHYVTLGTNDLPRARSFYNPTLATLGLMPIVEKAVESGYGLPGHDRPRPLCRHPL